jgi:phosphatidylinositol 4-kinase
MSPDKTAMSLDSLSIVTTDQNDNVNIPQAINSAKPPLPSSSKRSRSSGQGKQSWLLRLFESKLFDMSIAISYLFNSKEPGVQTYLGKY